MSIDECIEAVKALDKHVHPLKGSVRREVIRLLTAMKDNREDCERRDSAPGIGRRCCNGCDR